MPSSAAMMDSTNSLQSTEHPEVEIRPARKQDRGFVRSLAVDVFSVYGSYGRYLAEWFDSENVKTWIGEVEKKPVGLVMLQPRPHGRNPQAAVAELLAIAVEPAIQSRGVGSVLLDHAISEAPSLQCPLPILEIHLSVAEGNSKAQRLFSRRGFRFRGGEGIYPAGQRALHMIRRIDPKNQEG
jgi:ribosomal protein S18 acetylase RimI-like enzyme